MSTSLPIIPNKFGASYPVRLAVFEGPLDLLLHLIEREELDISEISLVAVTDQYLRALEEMEEIQAGALADFLVVAARLIFIKSRSLLPKPRPPDDEEEEDPGQALIRQLLEYRQFKAVAAGLRQRQEAGLRVFVRLAPPPSLERKLDLSDVGPDALQRAVQRALRRIPSDPPLPKVHAYPITVAEQIQTIRRFVRRLRTGPDPQPVRFSQLLSRGRTRMEIVVTFLAVLELIKQRELEAWQDEIFGDILLRPGQEEPQEQGPDEPDDGEPETDA